MKVCNDKGENFKRLREKDWLFIIIGEGDFELAFKIDGSPYFFMLRGICSSLYDESRVVIFTTAIS